MPAIELEAFVEDFDDHDLTAKALSQQSAGLRQAHIPAAGFGQPDQFVGSAFFRCDDTEVRVIGDLYRAPACPFGKVAFGKRLEAPGDAAE